MAVTAADCAGLHPGTSPQPGCGVRQTSSPVSSLRAHSPPPALLSMSRVTLGLRTRGCAPGVPAATGWNLGSDTATKRLLSSAATPHCTPPSVLPLPTLFCQTISPPSSGSRAVTTPDFCPATRMRLPLERLARTADDPKSKSGPLDLGQLIPFGQARVNASPGVICRVHAKSPEPTPRARKASDVSVVGSE